MIVLGRIATWTNRRRAHELFTTAYMNAPGTDLLYWAYWAISGVRDSTGSEHLVEVMTGFTVLTLIDILTRPDCAGAFVAATHRAVPDIAEAVVHAALRELWRRVQETSPVEAASSAFMNIVRGLNNEHRQLAAEIALEH